MLLYFVAGRKGGVRLVSGRVSSRAAPVRGCCQRARDRRRRRRQNNTNNKTRSNGRWRHLWCTGELAMCTLYRTVVVYSCQRKDNMTHDGSRGTFRGGPCVPVPNFTHPDTRPRGSHCAQEKTIPWSSPSSVTIDYRPPSDDVRIITTTNIHMYICSSVHT